MKKLVGMLLILTLATSAFAIEIVESTDVLYLGGTVQTVSGGALGHFDTTSPNELAFDANGKRIVIPYDKIQSFQYSRKLARHYGALLTVAIVMFKFRQRRHFVTISYRDSANVEQVAIFEISKEMPLTLMPVLAVRAPQGCKSDSFNYETSLGQCSVGPKLPPRQTAALTSMK
jgi:hypothetical protein